MDHKQQFWDIVAKACRSDPRKTEECHSASNREPNMDADIEIIADVILALTHLLRCDERIGAAAWSSHDPHALHRLCEKGYVLTNHWWAVASTKEGEAKAEELFWKLFGKNT
jgi:hypothetical protein